MLNLPKTAADHEFRERYRQLSVVFHPDKQTDPERKEAASQRFLEVQKAYEGAQTLRFVRVCSSSLTSSQYCLIPLHGTYNAATSHRVPRIALILSSQSRI